MVALSGSSWGCVGFFAGLFWMWMFWSLASEPRPTVQPLRERLETEDKLRIYHDNTKQETDAPLHNKEDNFKLNPIVDPEELRTAEWLRDRYLSIVRDAITGAAFPTTERSVPYVDDVGNMKMSEFKHIDPKRREEGYEWPFVGLTMIGTKRMDNIRYLLEKADEEGIEGDFMECGVWRGGGVMYAKAVLDSRIPKKGQKLFDRDIWLADSFSGLPLPRAGEISGDDSSWNHRKYLSVSLDEVKANMKGFGLWDESLHICKGFFVDTLPTCKPDKIAILRLDGDMYESTMDELFNLYDRVEVGGWIVVDDWRIANCKKAIKEFWHMHNIPSVEGVDYFPIDGTAMYWQKKKEVTLNVEFYGKLLKKNKD